jgi:hypothetical protein
MEATLNESEEGARADKNISSPSITESPSSQALDCFASVFYMEVAGRDSRLH